MAESPASQSASAWRSKVTVRPLPEDFLRISNQQYSAGSQQRLGAEAMRNVQRMVYAPPHTVGRLVLSVVQAKLIKSYSRMFKMDPYCRIRMGHQVFETHTAQGGGKEPHWNKTIHCYLPIGCDKIAVEIFDEKSFGEDERVAWTQIDIPAAVYEGDTVDEWFPLSGKSGENGAEGSIQLTFSLHVNPSGQPQPMAMPYMAGMPGVPGVPMFYPGMIPAQQQIPVQQRQMYTDDDLKQVKEMFPEMDNEVIHSVLEAQGGNVQATINALLEMN